METLSKTEETLKNSRNLFAFWFALSFILNGYASGIPGISLGSLVFIFMVLAAFRYRLFETANNVLLFTVVLLITSYIGMYFNGREYLDLRAHVISLAKLLLWTSMSTVVARTYYDFDSIYKYIRIFGYILLVYLVIQTISFYGFHIYLPNIFDLGIIRPYAEDYASSALGTARIIRPASFLSESAFLGSYLMCMLAMIFEKGARGGKLSMSEATIVSLGVLLTSSSSALVLLPLIWIVYWKTLDNTSRVRAVFILFIAAILLFVVTWIPGIVSDDFAYSAQYSVDKFSRLEKLTRFGKSYNYLNLLDTGELFFGVGLGNDDYFLMVRAYADEIYLNSITSLIVSSGGIGLLFFLVLCLSLRHKAAACQSKLALVLLVIYFIKGFAGGMYFSTYGVMYMFIICGDLMSRSEQKSADLQKTA